MKTRVQAILRAGLPARATLWVASANADGFYIGLGAYKTDMSIDEVYGDDDD